MQRFLDAARKAALPLALMFALMPLASQAAVKAGTQTFEGTVVHVSADNIKVKNPQQEMTFLIVPRFGNIAGGSSGRMPMQMKDIHAGSLVKVYYDQKFLGRPHADRILVLNRMEMPKVKLKG